jgi:HCOMODA/2-hydroxy-3-carboxy-muconic semialdehyde decarboxylase
VTPYTQELTADIAVAAQALSRLGLVTAFGHVSARTDDGLTITPGTDLAIADASRMVVIPFDASSLPPGAPAEAWLHLALSAARPDVLAIARAQPPSSIAAAAAGGPIRPLHGQAAWLGRALPVHDDARLLRTRALAAALSLPEGEALLLRGNGAVTTGDTPGLAVARMWLLDVTCAAWTAAHPDERRPLNDDEIDSWRAVAGELLPRLWRHLERKAFSVVTDCTEQHPAGLPHGLAGEGHEGTTKEAQ